MNGVNGSREYAGYVICKPLDVMAGLAALVPKPCVNLTREHGVFAGKAVVDNIAQEG